MMRTAKTCIGAYLSSLVNLRQTNVLSPLQVGRWKHFYTTGVTGRDCAESPSTPIYSDEPGDASRIAKTYTLQRATCSISCVATMC